jgi:O-antigen/teichoic acid export membrane protein
MNKFKLVIHAGSTYAASTLIGLVFSVLCTHLMGAGEFGDLRYVMTWLPIFMTMTLPGYDSVILRETNFGRFIPLLKILFVRIAGGVLGSLILFCIFSLQHTNYSQDVWFFLICAIVTLPFFETATGYKNYLISTHLKKFGLTLLLRNRVITFALLLLAGISIYYFKLSPRLLFPAYLIAMIIPPMLTGFDIFLRQQKSVRFAKFGQLHIFSAIQTSFAGLIGTFAFSLDKLMLHHYLGGKVLAWYSILVMFPVEIAKLIDSLYPIFYKKLFLDKSKLLLKTAISILAFSFVLIAVYSTVFYLISPIVFGGYYRYNFGIVLFAASLMLSGAFEFYFVQRLFASHGGSILLTYSIISIIVCFSLYTYVLPGGGVFGLILAIALRQLALPIIFQLFIRRYGSRKSFNLA